MKGICRLHPRKTFLPDKSSEENTITNKKYTLQFSYLKKIVTEKSQGEDDQLLCWNPGEGTLHRLRHEEEINALHVHQNL